MARKALKESVDAAPMAAKIEPEKPIGPKPYAFTPELAAEICRRMSEGESLSQVCRDPSMPYRRTVREWRKEHPEFATLYAHAREELYEHWASEITEISDDGTNDWIERELRGGRVVTVPDYEHIARSRLRVDSRKWMLSKLLPRQYGDKLELSGSVAHPQPAAEPVSLEEAESAYLSLVNAPPSGNPETLN